MRKCWARKLRELLVLKSQLYNVTVSTEPELLSLLSTADIQTVGAEVLLTWGGPALASITNIEVAHEVKIVPIGNAVKETTLLPHS